MAFPTTEANVEVAEKELAVRLPREYRNRLIAVNGGELTTGGDNWKVFPVLDTSDQRKAKRSANHVVLATLEARARDGFPEDAVAIAENGSGNFLVLLPRKGRLDPQVHVWDHETRKCVPVPLRYDYK